MMLAEHIEQVESGEVGLGPIDAMVPLEVGLRRATFSGTGRVQPLESRLLDRARLATEVCNTDHSLPTGQDGHDERAEGT
jgi:hypothetical protein